MTLAEIKLAPGIGVENERSLHAAIRNWYAQPGDQFEVKVENWIIDIVRQDVLIEIQTRNFAAIRNKLRQLLPQHPVQLIYPLAQEKWIVHVAPENDQMIRRRKSPKTGKLVDIFNELVRIPDLLLAPNLSLMILFTRLEEIRCADGKGSWRRQGVSIRDTQLLEVTGQIELRARSDFFQFLPSATEQPFSNRDLAGALKCTRHLARRVSYCLKKSGIIQQVGKQGNELLFQRVE